MRLLMLPSAIELLGSCAPSSRAWRESSRTCSAEGQNHPAAGADVLSGKGLETAAWSGAPGGSRTPGPRLRRPLLYPAELQARAPCLCRRCADASSGGDTAPVGGKRSLTPSITRSRTLRFRGADRLGEAQVCEEFRERW